MVPLPKAGRDCSPDPECGGGAMPRSARAAVTAVVASLILGACTMATDDVADPTLGDLRGRTVDVIATWSGAEQDNFRAVLDEFERRTHATVNYTSGGTDIAVLLGSRL